jgi:hypothetical protein
VTAQANGNRGRFRSRTILYSLTGRGGRINVPDETRPSSKANCPGCRYTPLLMPRRVPPASLIVVLLLPATLYAWGVDGHQITCLIAEERLSDQAKAGIHELLGDDVDISDADVAAWADNVRRERRSTAPWHYVDIPADATAFDAKRDGNGGKNVIDKIDEFEKVLSDPSKPKEQRAEALKYLVHFVGDVHQPMHCVDRKGDRGGNKRLVFVPWRQAAVNLHTCWDSIILLHKRGPTRDLDYALALNKKITAAQSKAWASGTPQTWANESHTVAVNVAYAGVPADGDPPNLDDQYVDRAANAIDEQLAKGGVRLAMLLNRCFANQPATQPSAAGG